MGFIAAEAVEDAVVAEELGVAVGEDPVSSSSVPHAFYPSSSDVVAGGDVPSGEVVPGRGVDAGAGVGGEEDVGGRVDGAHVVHLALVAGAAGSGDGEGVDGAEEVVTGVGEGEDAGHLVGGVAHAFIGSGDVGSGELGFEAVGHEFVEASWEAVVGAAEDLLVFGVGEGGDGEGVHAAEERVSDADER